MTNEQKNQTEASQLVVELRNEFNRPVPIEYAPLIERAKGNTSIDFEEHEEPIFFDVQDPLAAFLVDGLCKDKDAKEAFRNYMKGKDFVDLGCGYPKFPPVFWDGPLGNGIPSMADFVKSLGAKRYIGVDLNLTDYTFSEHIRREGDFDRIYIGKEDMLHFLATMPDANKHPTGKVLFLSGIESLFSPEAYEDALKKIEDNPEDFDAEGVIKDNTIRGEYHDALYNEMDRVTKAGDVVFIGHRTNKSFRSGKLKEMGFRRMKGQGIYGIHVKDSNSRNS